VAAQLIAQQQHLHTVRRPRYTRLRSRGLLLRKNLLLPRLFKTTTIHLWTMKVKTRRVEAHTQDEVSVRFFLSFLCFRMSGREGQRSIEALKHRRRCPRGCGPVQCVQLLAMSVRSLPVLLFLFSFSYHSFRLTALLLFSFLLIYPLH
jgi:hypothetical protein